MAKHLLLTLLIIASALAAISMAAPATKKANQGGKSALGDLTAERERAFALLIKNVSPDGALPGSVVAALSKVDPPYFFHWVRDGGLVARALVDEYANPDTPAARVAKLEKDLWDLAKLTSIQQSKVSRSADARFNDPQGITEPKYFVEDGRPFDGEWGRPQDDGPPIRALALMDFAIEYIRRTGDKTRVLRELYRAELPAQSPIKKDLEVVAYTAGKRTSFELWEEVKGKGIHCTLVQHRALETAAKFVASIGAEPAAAKFYGERAKELRDTLLPRFFDAGRGYAVATLERDGGLDYKNSNLDVATILGAIHADPLATRVSSNFTTGANDNQYYPDDTRVLLTAVALKDAHRAAFAINTKNRPDLPPAIGRYTEDRYFGGNPWFLTTYALAEQHYRAATRMCAANAVKVDGNALKFWTDLVEGKGGAVQAGTFNGGSAEFTRLIGALATRGDGYVQRAALHRSPDGSMAEQLDRNTGFQISAKDLTWGYASFVTALRARERAQALCGQVFP